MKFSFIKDGKVDLDLLVKKWTSNFSITEYLIWKDVANMSLAVPEYFLSVFRNKRFYEFDLTKDEANFIIWFLDLVTFMKSSNVSHFRIFYKKEDHAKVIHGYTSEAEITFDQEYGPENYKEKQIYKMKDIEQSGYDYNTRVSSKSIKMQKAFLLTGLIKFYDEEVMINGGPLHIILEDGNFEQHHIKACRDHADPNDYITNEILSLMEVFTEEELEVIIYHPYEITNALKGCNPSFKLF